MSSQNTNVDDLLARLGLTKKSESTSFASPGPTDTITKQSTGGAPIPSSTTPGERTPPPVRSEQRGREQDAVLAETLQRLKQGGAPKPRPTSYDPAPASTPTRSPSPALQSATPSPTAVGLAQPKTGIPSPRQQSHRAFTPIVPRSLQDAGLTESEVSSLILKYLIHRGVESGGRIAKHIGLCYPVIEQVLRQLKNDKLVVYKSSMAGGDFQYELTELGRERAHNLSRTCTYFGTAPVPLSQYIASVKAQTITGLKPPLSAIRNALGELNINGSLLSSVGQAIHSGRGMFLFGSPGNGKTSIAERITKSFGDSIWIPRCISASGEIIRLFDPNRHKPMDLDETDDQLNIDGRWVRIERPTIIAGGELRMENLEITMVRDTGVGEAPLQLKANCGTLLIDDFGRQTMPVDQLLNRWIIPLEQRHDFLQLESGRSIQVPFDELIIFSTNLEPGALADDAFLRRIPYKIEVKDPSPEEFRNLMLTLAHKIGFECEPSIIDYLIEKHYLPVNRPFRFCHPRDLLRQVENLCTLHELPYVVTPEAIDQAVSNYFSIIKPKTPNKA
ncbi:MAG: AAA family ATPase [Planctomycetaceae bacterium]